jgi:hypothetical protein
MASITLTKVQDPAASRWLMAINSDYDVPKGATVFSGYDHEGNGDRIAIWVAPDGGGFGAIDRDPDGYVAFSDAMWAGDFAAAKVASEMHPGVDEWEFDPGTFDPTAETIEVGVRQSFF